MVCTRVPWAIRCAGFVCVTEEEASKLAALKDRIRASGYPVTEDLKDPQAIAERIEADLWDLIHQLFPTAEQPDGLEIEETGSTYLENARLKAETVARLTGTWALADDSGIEVDALGGAPGIYSARYGPTDHERIHRLLKELGDSLYRGASFRTAMVLADASGTIRAEAEGICRGQILREPEGHGPGYDSLFYVREAGSSYALMGPHLKAKLGSRGKAARQLAPDLRRLLGIPG